MQVTSKTVTETLIAVDGQRIPAARLRGLKPSAVRFCFQEKLMADYRGYGVLLTPKGVDAVKAVKPEWQSVMRAAADASRQAA